MSFPGFPASADPGWWRVVDNTPAIQEPVTVAEAREFAPQDLTLDDAIFSGLISMAREYVETALARTVAARVRTVYFQGFPWTGGAYQRMIRGFGLNPWWFPSGQGVIQVRNPPLQGIQNIQYADVSSGVLREFDPSLTIISTGTPGRISPTWGTIWPLARPQIDAVQITFVAGYGLTAPFVETVGGPPSQTLMIYGQPTGGSFTLTYSGNTTNALSYAAAASDVQSELQLLSGIGTDNVDCFGGPLPTIPIFIAWAGTLASTFYHPLITTTSSLTGDSYARASVVQPPALPHSIRTAILQIVASSYENREAEQEVAR